jgi:hypothetical protein
MQETPQQYTQRVLGYIDGKKPLDILGTTPRKVAALIKGVTKKKLATRPAPDKWSVTEILAHLADVEIVQGVRLRLILESSGVPIQGFDQEVWARYSDYAKHDTALSFEAYKVNRERTVRLLKGLPRGMWENYGMHSERGKETVTRVTEMMAGHDINHLEQIRRILKGK